MRVRKNAQVIRDLDFVNVGIRSFMTTALAPYQTVLLMELVLKAQTTNTVWMAVTVDIENLEILVFVFPIAAQDTISALLLPTRLMKLVHLDVD